MNSEIIHHSTGSTTFAGRDAVNLFRAITLKSALNAYAKHKMLMTRSLTPSIMLQMAEEYTGKAYKRGQQAKAAEDLTAWIQTMQAALPVTHN